MAFAISFKATNKYSHKPRKWLLIIDQKFYRSFYERAETIMPLWDEKVIFRSAIAMSVCACYCYAKLVDYRQRSFHVECICLCNSKASDAISANINTLCSVLFSQHNGLFIAIHTMFPNSLSSANQYRQL